MRRWIDPLVDGRADPRIAVALLGLSMLVSLIYSLWVGRGLTFSGDEFAWVSFSPGLDLRDVLAALNGHLVVVSHLLYKAILEVLGSDYLYFRILTLGSLFLSVGLFFFYARRRVGDFIALAPCLVLLFFGSDPTHVLAGNGFTVLFAISCGLLALVALERQSRFGDAAAAVALVLGVLTYTSALPFVAGVLVLVALSRDRWRRIWIPLIPILVYLAWRLYVVVDDVAIVRGGLEASNLVLTPAWSFQSISGILNALTGVNYNFAAGGGALPAGEMAGPALALVFLAAIGWQISNGAGRPGLWAALTIMLTLFISQVLVWIPEVRDPGTARYLFPGAFALLLVLVEAFRSQRANRSAFLMIWIVALCALATNAALLHGSGNSLRGRTDIAKSEVFASVTVSSAHPYFSGPGAVPLDKLVTDPLISLVGGAERRYGGIGFTEKEILQQTPGNRSKVDRIISRAFGLGLLPFDGPRPEACRLVEADPGPGETVEATLPSRAVTLESKSPGNVLLRRFDPAFSTKVGSLAPNQKMSLYIPVDDGHTPWRLMAEVPSLTICELE